MENISLDNFGENFSFRAENVHINGFVSKQGVANFLGIPYAQFPARFRTARLIDLGLLRGQLDASRYGPRCPQKTDNIHPMMHHMFEKLSMSQRCDETTCLHLNIYTPPLSVGVPEHSDLPVFMWIHGGGFNNGDNTTEFNGNHLVRRSMDLGRPIIIVTLNYRLNVFGFLSSKELVQEAISLGETPVLNQGLNDQRIGLEWIQRSIHHFGGDPSKVTISGESAGAASIFCHLRGGHALFQQALIQSSPRPRLRTLEEAQAVFDQLARSAGIASHATSTEKLAGLRALSPDQLLELFDGSVSLPLEDSSWFEHEDQHRKSGPTASWGDMPKWCSRIIMGHTKDEAALFLTPFQNLPDAALVEYARKLVPGIEDDALFSKGKSALQTLTEWATEETFVKPTMEMLSEAADQGTTVYAYEISVVDPFPGPLHGYSWHSFGVPLTFYEPPGRVHAHIAATQDKMSTAHIDFIHGLEPWVAFNVGRLKMRWDGEQTRLEDTSVVGRGEGKDKGLDMPCRTSAETGQGIIAAALKMQTS
ncbi:uncharacterized protein Z520_01213 [Fonsecaea multimorphosa CBS 102226]|uniref:Carboxylic ester hydrolase n=1 Tax=Fonsecaea multimorphosa CBS 102226 TaxID=1442371 RepID=A0A0D2K9L3_9EURO|nr:uncharacterized protein Z520_01213 [Fonsecaea multimorphosa CBS 102226]KIY02748.1 hypothetical protein Z520_01213 [Fonsecaea multimorphosa CBS 102226]OAL31171.1 hypothetical protein AYO22_01204 [Fonsecaea multimorphosa]